MDDSDKIFFIKFPDMYVLVKSHMRGFSSLSRNFFATKRTSDCNNIT